MAGGQPDRQSTLRKANSANTKCYFVRTQIRYNNGMYVHKAKPLPFLSEATIRRFWSHVQVWGIDACWCWKAQRVQGYGRFEVGGRALRANRIALFLGTGVDPAPLYACHTCDNRACCNPAHIYRGTYDDNMRDMRMRTKIPRQRRPVRVKRKDIKAYVKAKVWR